MNKTQIILVLCLLTFSLKVFSQEIISVDHAYGKAEVVIPIVKLEVDGIQLPIHLKYNTTGVKCDAIPTSVGLNWKLFIGGSIGREITNNPDESVDGIIQGNLDDHYDRFYYGSLFGSGKFNYGHDSFVPQINNNLVMEYDDPNTGGYLSYFQITDDVGNNYYFGDVDNPTNYNYRNQTDVNTLREGTTDNELSFVGVNEWLINKIVTRNGQEIYFNYTAYNLDSYSVSNYDLVDSENGIYETLVTTYNSEVNLIKSIESDNYFIEFTYSNDETLNIWKEKLLSIEVRPSQSSSVILKKVEFRYDKFTDNRLKLNSVVYLGDNNEEGGKYEFAYYNEENIDNPMLIGSQSKDYFGYYNGKDNSGAPSYFNRNVTTPYVKNRSLETITYPSGATAKLYYEPNEGNTEYTTIYYCYYILNSESNDNIQSEYIIDAEDQSVADTIIITEEVSGVTKINYPGLRIKEIEIDKVNTRKYTYSDDVQYRNGVLTYQNVNEELFSTSAFEASSITDYHFEIDARGYPYLQDQYLINNNDTLLKQIHFDYEHWSRNGGDFVSVRDPYLPIRKTTTEYFWDRFAASNTIREDEGTIISVEEYSYNYYWLLDQVDYINRSTNIVYSSDYDSLLSNDNYEILVAKNILAIPTGKKVINGDFWTQGTISKLDNNGNPLEVYKVIGTTSNSSFPHTQNIYYDLVESYEYTPNGLVKDIQTPEGDKKSFLRDNRDNLTAKVTNAASDAVYYNSFEENGVSGNAKTGYKYAPEVNVSFSVPSGYNLNDFVVSYWYLESDVWKYKEILLPGNQFTLTNGDGIDELKIYPKNAHMVTYNYDDHDRVISNTDVNGITTWYDYDNFGRICTIKDNSGYIRKNYEYASKNEVADISTSTSSFSIERTGGIDSFRVSSDKDYTIKTDNNWININTGYTFGTKNIEFSCESNEGTEARNGKITISSQNSIKTIRIYQDGPELSIDSFGFINRFGPMGGSRSLTVDANFDDWNFSILPENSFLSVVRSGNKLLITCAENEVKFGRIAIITIDGRGDADANIRISQEGAIIFSVSPSDLNFTLNGGTKSSIVTANFDDWEVSNNQSWISTTELENEINVEVTSENLNETSRTGTVTISGRNNTKTINVTQTGILLSLDETGLDFISNPISAQTVSITSNYHWEIEVINSKWISVNKTSGSGNSTFTISCSANNSTSSRTGIVTVTAGNVIRTINITQEAPVLNYRINGINNPSSISFDAASINKTVYVYSNIDSWAVSDNVSWITIENTSGSMNGSFTLQISANSGSSSRSATITISSLYVNKTFTITQSAESITVTPTRIDVGSSVGTASFTITSNTSWTISEDRDWLSVSQTSGSGNATINVHYNSNSSILYRLGDIIVSGEVSVRMVRIVQDRNSGSGLPVI